MREDCACPGANYGILDIKKHITIGDYTHTGQRKKTAMRAHDSKYVVFISLSLLTLQFSLTVKTRSRERCSYC